MSTLLTQTCPYPVGADASLAGCWSNGGTLIASALNTSTSTWSW